MTSPPPWAARVLVADDDAEMRALLVDLLREEGCIVTDAFDGSDALARLTAEQLGEFELIITDYRMPGRNGLEVAASVEEMGGPPVVLMSAFLDETTADQASVARVATVLSKPFAMERLLAIVRGLIGPL